MVRELLTGHKVLRLDSGCGGAVIGDWHGRKYVVVAEDLSSEVSDGNASSHKSVSMGPAISSRACAYASISVVPPGPTPITMQERETTCSGEGER